MTNRSLGPATMSGRLGVSGEPATVLRRWPRCSGYGQLYLFLPTSVTPRKNCVPRSGNVTAVESQIFSDLTPASAMFFAVTPGTGLADVTLARGPSTPTHGRMHTRDSHETRLGLSCGIALTDFHTEPRHPGDKHVRSSEAPHC